MIFNHLNIALPYNDLVTKEENGKRVYVTPAGNEYHSITTILGATKKDIFKDWRKNVGDQEADRVIRHALTRGTILHDTAEKYLKNELTEMDCMKLMPHTKFSWNALKNVINKNINNIHFLEAPLYSDRLRVAGRVDIIAEFLKVPSIIDLKTSSSVKTKEDIESYFKQATAYSYMYEEQTGIKIESLIILMIVDGLKKVLIFKENRNNWIKDLESDIENYYASNTN